MHRRPREYALGWWLLKKDDRRRFHMHTHALPLRVTFLILAVRPLCSSIAQWTRPKRSGHVTRCRRGSGALPRARPHPPTSWCVCVCVCVCVCEWVGALV
jgi:hypothetical protein